MSFFENTKSLDLVEQSTYGAESFTSPSGCYVPALVGLIIHDGGEVHQSSPVADRRHHKQ